MDLCISGCGFLVPYYIGVAACFKKYAPQLLQNKISSSSAGVFVACCLLSDVPLEVILSSFLHIRQEVLKYTFGPFNPFCSIQELIIKGFHQILPEDAHIRVNGRLHISLTRVCDGKNIIISQFSSKDDLIQAIVSATFVPFYTNLLPPRYRDVLYIDGAFTNNVPVFDKNTIVIGVCSGEPVDLCPNDISARVFFHISLFNIKKIEVSIPNLYRSWGVIFPHKVETLLDISKQGFDNALKFLHCNDLLKCTKCPVQSTFEIQKTIESNTKTDPECEECKLHIQEALVAELPETIRMTFQSN